LEEARRAGKRQAAPFSRGQPKSAEVDEQFDVLLAPRCECGGEIVQQGTEYLFQDALPEPRPIRWRFAVHIGKCACCGRRHQGRHPFQTADALGAAWFMLGPRAVTSATEL
jgi:transposase